LGLECLVAGVWTANAEQNEVPHESNYKPSQNGIKCKLNVVHLDDHSDNFFKLILL